MQFYNRNQDLIHRNLKEHSERVEIIYRGQAFALLPLVDRPRFFKAEVALQIPDGQAALHAQTADVVSRRDEIDHFMSILLASFKVVILQNIRDGSRMQDDNALCNSNVKLEGDEV